MTGKPDRQSKIFIFILAFTIPFLMTLLFWGVCGMYPFGTNSILTGDMNIEFINFYAYFINTLKTGNDWSYMLTKTIGGDFPGLAAYELHDPLLFILALFPTEEIVVGVELIFCIQTGLAGLCMSVLLNSRYKRSYKSLLFSTAYSFSAFFFGYLVLTFYFTAIAILPLVIYFFLKTLDDDKGIIPFIIMSAVYIYLNYYLGFMLVIFLVIMYVSALIRDGSYIKRLGKLIIAGSTVVLLDGFFLVRTGLSLVGEKTTAGADYGLYRRFPLNQLFAGLYSGCAGSDLRPLIYCSVAAFFFAVAFLVSGKISIREKASVVFVIGAISVSMWINTLDTVWHGFNNPEGFWWRYAYYISLVVVIIGYRGFILLVSDEDAPSQSGAKIIRPVVVSSAILLAYMAWLKISGNFFLDIKRIVINVVLIAVITISAVVIIKKRKYAPIAFSIMFIAGLFDMIYTATDSYIGINADNGVFPQIDSFKEDYRDIGEAISYIKSEDPGTYRIEKDFDRAINDPSLFDYIGLSHDSSTEKDDILDWLVNFGFCKTVYYTYYNGGSTTFVDDLFGVKYYVSRFDGVEKPYGSTSYDGKYYVFKNEDALPLAFIAPNGLTDEDITEGDTFEKQNRIASYWNDEPVYTPADPVISLEGAVETEPGKYTRTGDEGFIHYDIPVVPGKPLYFYFYAPNRQEAEVFVNGESRDVYFTVNHWNTLCAGRYEEDDTLRISMQIKGEDLVISKACFYYEDEEALHKWGREAAKLDAGIGPVEKITSSRFKFSTDSSKDETVIMSIPNDDSWKVTVDGNRTGTSPALGMLLSFNVPAGTHEIEMIYTPAGTYPGLALSIAGLVLLAVLISTKDKPEWAQKLLKRSKIQKNAE